MLVLLVVAALTAALALCPADTLGRDAVGVGTGTGDLLAAALSRLDQDMHDVVALPAPQRHPASGPLPDVAVAPEDVPCAPPPAVQAPPPPRSALLAGPAPAAHPLLL
jgi:hypothetical protein